METIKVLMLLPDLHVANGVASYAMNYFRLLNYDTVHMDFAVYANLKTPYVAEIEAAGGHVFVLPPLKNLPAHCQVCRELLRNGYYDIVHDNTLINSIPLMSEAKRQNVPVRILHSHSSKLGGTHYKKIRNKLFLPFLKNTANYYATCSDLAAKAMFEDEEYEFIPTIVDVDKYHFDESVRQRVRYDMNVDNKKVVATVGRAAPEKNLFFALDVFDLVAERIPQAEYWWIGSGPLDKEVADYAGKLKHADRVQLLGSRDDMRELYQAVDLFFLPSIFEGLPVTGVESQAVGLPSVISDIVTKEMVYTDLVEFVPLDAPIETWVEAIERQMKRIPERRSYTKELENSAFFSEHAGERLEAYYKRLLSDAMS